MTTRCFVFSHGRPLRIANWKALVMFKNMSKLVILDKNGKAGVFNACSARAARDSFKTTELTSVCMYKLVAGTSNCKAV